MMVNLGAAVNVIHGIRTHTAQHTGCPEWDAPGIRAMLTGSEGSPGSVLAAACLAAEDPACLKPSPAALRNHWPVNAPSTPPRVPQLDLCPEHGNPRRDCLDCRRETGPDLTPEQIRANAAALRTQIAQAGRERVARLAAQRKAQTGDLA
jgi:hypothetical protein